MKRVDWEGGGCEATYVVSVRDHVKIGHFRARIAGKSEEAHSHEDEEAEGGLHRCVVVIGREALCGAAR
jgi:hypothetical protein